MKKILILSLLCTISTFLYSQENKNLVRKFKVESSSLKRGPTKMSSLPNAKIILQESKMDSSGHDLKVKAEIDNRIRKIKEAHQSPSNQGDNTVKVIYNSKEK